MGDRKTIVANFVSEASISEERVLKNEKDDNLLSQDSVESIKKLSLSGDHILPEEICHVAEITQRVSENENVRISRDNSDANYDESDMGEDPLVNHIDYHRAYKREISLFDELNEMNDDDNPSNKNQVKCFQIMILLVTGLILIAVVIYFGYDNDRESEMWMKY